MFVFEIRFEDGGKIIKSKLDEYELAVLIRLLKVRNRELFDKFNKFYDTVLDNIGAPTNNKPLILQL